MKVLIIRASDGEFDLFTVVGDDFTDERFDALQSSVEAKGGALLVYNARQIEEFEAYVKICNWL